MPPLSKPLASVSQPPTECQKGNRSTYRPPEWQKKVRRKPQNCESPPENLALHDVSLARSVQRQSANFSLSK